MILGDLFGEIALELGHGSSQDVTVGPIARAIVSGT